MYASRDLGAHALRLYLYLASNADGYKLALSPADIRQRVGMPSSTYRDQFEKLVDKGYLVPNSSNGYDFYEVPQTRAAIEAKETNEGRVSDEEKETPTAPPWAAPTPSETTESIEINNRTNTTNKGINNGVIEVKEVRITPPEAFGKKRPEQHPTTKPAQTFIF